MFNPQGFYRSFVRGGIERYYPDAYAVTASGDCMAPIWTDGDMLLVSPSVKLTPGRFVVLAVKGVDGRREMLGKRLLCPIPFFKRDGTGPLVVVEMFSPAKRMGFEQASVEYVHAVVGVSRGGAGPMVPVGFQAAQGSAP